MQALFTCPTGQQLQVRRSCPHAKASRPPVYQARHTRHAAGSQQRLSQRQLTVTCAAAEEDAASLPTEDDAEPLSAQAPPKIRIMLKSYDKTLISESGTTIVDSAKATGWWHAARYHVDCCGVPLTQLMGLLALKTADLTCLRVAGLACSCWGWFRTVCSWMWSSFRTCRQLA